MDGGAGNDQRQLAALILKNSVKEHWSPTWTRYTPPTVPAGDQVAVRGMIVAGLSDPSGRIRGLLGSAVAAIASTDFPELWPDLVQQLLALVRAGGVAAQGALVTLAMIADDLRPEALPAMAGSGMLSEFIGLFNLGTAAQGQLSERDQARVASIFTSVVMSIKALPAAQRKLACQAFSPLVEGWMTAFAAGMAAALHRGGAVDCKLRIEIVKAVESVVLTMAKQAAPHIGPVLGVMWGALLSAQPLFEREVANTGGIARGGYDTDGNLVGFEVLCLELISLVGALINSSTFRPTLAPGVRDLAFAVVGLMQLTDAQSEAWANDPDAFVEHEDEEQGAYSVRMASINLLCQIAERYQEAGLQAVGLAAARHLEASESARLAGNALWWKQREAAYLALGSTAEAWIEHMESVEQLRGSAPQHRGLRPIFDIPGFMAMHVVADARPDEVPFLTGRAIWAASCMVQLLPLEQQRGLLDSVARGACLSAHSVIRVCAIKAFARVEAVLPRDMVAPLCGPVLAGCTDLLRHTSEGGLGLMLHVVSLAIRIDPNAVQASNRGVILASHLLGMWKKTYHDYITVMDLNYVIFRLASVPGLGEAIQAMVLPTVAGILQSTAPQPSEIIPPIIDLLASITRASPGPLTVQVLDHCFGPLLTLLITCSADDGPVIQNGCRALAALVLRNKADLVHWKVAKVDPDMLAANNSSLQRSGSPLSPTLTGRLSLGSAAGGGAAEKQTGLQAVLAIIHRFYESDVPDSALLNLGNLITQVVRQCGPSLTQQELGALFSGLTQRIRAVVLPTVLQGLLGVFAAAMHDCPEVVLAHLKATAASPELSPDNLSNTEFAIIVRAWTKWAPGFEGGAVTKASLAGLAVLLEREGPALAALPVDAASADTEGGSLAYLLVSGSRTKKRQQQQQQPATKSALERIFEILATAFAKRGVADMAGAGQWIDESGDGGGDDDDNDLDDVSPFASIDEFKYLSSILEEEGGADGFEPPEGDLANQIDPHADIGLEEDPVAARLDLGAFLTDFFKRAMTADPATFTALVSRMQPAEQERFKKALSLSQ
jgi:hypothetical protein